ncbi:Acyl-CoA-binding domain-containing protein 6 [Chionoecetes opilio]|uniref:Acyl-CoA-binding domain-containing protein 6 n=1 Tax=Chionoecetes opilio TaxID=41210 RepID=A0A8J4Y720_CHIOP|nr:Acyl-CoA-binding domain-containing protein 6 [Chionoecetes opilio]
MEDLDAGPTEGEEEALFNKATAYLQTLASNLPQDKLLHFYARYKQATEGPCNIPKPGFFDFKGKQKWEAWKSMGDMSKDNAMLEYVNAMREADPEWELKADSEKGGGSSSSWVRVSTLQQQPDDVTKDEDKNHFDWVKENNVEKVKKLERGKIMEKDENGMTLLHWAADRGHQDMARYLLEQKLDVNARDSEGQTALHYAASCGHLDVVRVLLRHGGDPTIQDAEGLQPEECAEETDVKMIFKNL